MQIDHVDTEALRDCLLDVAAILDAMQGKVRSPPNQKKEPRWIVNDSGELGVEIEGRCFFLYKGGNIEYEDGKHDNGEPILYRSVGKREFGETTWPLQWYINGRSEDRYTEECVYHKGLSDGPKDNPEYQWLPLPVSKCNGE